MSKRKTKMIVAGVMGTAMTMMMAGCGANTTSPTMPQKPTDTNCSDWDYDEKTGTYQCDDRGSNYHGHYFYGGSYYNSPNSLSNSSAYQSGITNGAVSPSKSTNSSSTSKSGFGSGSKGGSFGG